MVEALASLKVAPGSDLVDRVVTRWVRVEARGLALYVAFGDHGVSYVRTGDSVDDRPEEFVDAYRRRFARPVVAGDRPPAGLLRALGTGRASEIEVDLREVSPFQRHVLEATARIPPGETRPYGWVAGEIGRPRAARAVGTALGRNPVPVLLPCHRVTRWDGSPGGYAFGSSVKEALLRSEQVNLDEVRRLARAGVFYVARATTSRFCLPTCHQARRTEAAHGQGFGTAADARRAGYRPCPDCRPDLEQTA